MKKIELIEVIADSIDTLNKYNSKQAVDIIVNTITDYIKSGEGVEIRGFGSFIRKHKNARIGINPRTGERTDVKAKNSPFFKPGKSLKKLVNNL